ncbi:hypothetical protein AC579_8364 [Pseudocercospora musae]|uniref:Integral membrane protein n=1 Tax=Pseudocercospora musae TaxID=113226 RepID=A0A139II48_9PEZI|nr:hypothetical protein AC579_8364 [Pseudocercospora musae]
MATARITADDQGAKVILAAALMLAYSTISVAIRLQTRWPWRQLYRQEDTMLMLAWISSIAYTASVALAVQEGFGLKDNLVPEGNDYRINILLSVSFVLFFVTKGLGTASYSMFLESLTEEDSIHRTVVKAGHVLSVVWIVPAIVTTAIYAAREDSKAAWIVFGATHAIVLAVLFGSTTRMITAARLSWHRKCRAVLWFGLAPCLVGVIIVRLAHTPHDVFVPGFTQSAIQLIIIMVIEMHFNLINAAYPNLLVFIDKTSTKGIHSAPRSVSIFAIPSSNSTSSSGKHSDLSLEAHTKLGSFRRGPRDRLDLNTSDSQKPIVGSSDDSRSMLDNDRDCSNDW